jgi:hypothetical protein
MHPYLAVILNEERTADVLRSAERSRHARAARRHADLRTAR